MRDLQVILDLKNMYDLIIEETKSRYKTRNPTKEEIRQYKKDNREWSDDNKYTFITNDIVSTIIKNCKTTTEVEFRTKLGFNQQDLVMNKEQSLLIKIAKVFPKEEKLPPYHVLGSKLICIFLSIKLAIEIDEEGHNDRNEGEDKKGKKILKISWLRSYLN